MARRPLGTTGKDIRSIRLELGMSFGELSRRADLEETDLRKIERGLMSIDADVIQRIALVLNVDAKDLHRAHTKLLKRAVPGEGYSTARPGDTFVREPEKSPATGVIPVLDLFCGTGGFSHGFERTKRFQVVGGIDLLPDRVDTFAANHPAARVVCGDIKSVSVDYLCRDCPSPEIIIGGPPCQGFSSIRPFRTLTEQDPRNNLFEHFALAVGAVRPAWFVLENVVGLITNQKGQAFESIMTVFGGLGYKLSWRVLNGAFYGLPQRRERFVLVGSRDGRDFEWPEPTHYLKGAKSMAGRFGQHRDITPLFSKKLERAVSVMEAIHDLPELRSGESSTSYRDDILPTAYEKEMRGECQLLTLHEATTHSEKMLEIIRHAGYNKSALPEGMVTSGFSTCYSRLEPDLPAVTVTVNFVHPASNKCIHPVQDRALTPREGARLQGFPDTYRFVGTRAQIVKQIGNAVPPLLGRIIADSLLKFF